MRRRIFLAGSLSIPALGATPLLPAAAAAGGASDYDRGFRDSSQSLIDEARRLIAGRPVDPHPEWLKQWRLLRDEWRSSEEGGQEEANLWERTKSIEDSLSSRAAQTASGALAQIEWMLADSLDMDFQVGHREALELAVQTLVVSVGSLHA